MPDFTVVGLNKFYSQFLKQYIQNLGGVVNANDNKIIEKCGETKM